MKRILTFFLVAFLSTYAIAQDKEADFIGGESTFYGTLTDRDVTIDYRAKIKYSATLFGGVKVNATVTEFVFWNVRYNGKKMNNAIYDELGVGDKDGTITPSKNSQFDFTTDIRFYLPPHFAEYAYKEIIRVGINREDQSFRTQRGESRVRPDNVCYRELGYFSRPSLSESRI